MKTVTIWPNTAPTTAVVLNEFTDDEGTFYIVQLVNGEKLCVDKAFAETIKEENIPLENIDHYEY